MEGVKPFLAEDEFGYVPRDKVVRDANSGSFYSSMSNVDIEIGPGNPAAAGVRS